MNIFMLHMFVIQETCGKSALQHGTK